MDNNQLNDVKDVMYTFLQEPTRENFSNLLLNGTGEQNAIDFKKTWDKDQKIAKTVLGIANTSPGAIIFGIEEKEDGTIEACGLTKLTDKADIQKKLYTYLPENLSFVIHNFDYSGEEYSKFKDKIFQVIMIAPTDDDLPYVCKKASDDLGEGHIYTRRGTNTLLANAVEVESLLNRRIETMHSTKSQLELEEHLKQLKILFKHIDKQHSTNNLFSAIVSGFKVSELRGIRNNPNYPKEDYEKFIVRMIDEKKSKIERVLDLR